MSSLWESGTGHIGVEDVRGVAVITLNRPESLNALSSAMRAELAQIIRAFGDGSRCRRHNDGPAGHRFVTSLIRDQC